MKKWIKWGWLALIVCVIVVLISVGVGISGQHTKVRKVEMRKLRFNPMHITIKVGDSVKWINRDQTAHTSTTDGFKTGAKNPSWMWNSGPLNMGQSFTHKFNKAGTYHYHCMVHPYMKGTVKVE